MTLKVISGGQTGADVAGLWAAKLFGIETGGWAPYGFLTIMGSRPKMADTFHMQEHHKGYAGRTIENIQESHLTILCSSKMSSGSALTVRECRKYHVPLYIFMFEPTQMEMSLAKSDFRGVVGRIRKAEQDGVDFVLNIAGNSSSSSKYAFEFTFKFCYMIFSELGYKTEAAPEDFSSFKDMYVYPE